MISIGPNVIVGYSPPPGNADSASTADSGFTPATTHQAASTIVVPMSGVQPGGLTLPGQAGSAALSPDAATGAISNLAGVAREFVRQRSRDEAATSAAPVDNPLQQVQQQQQHGHHGHVGVEDDDDDLDQIRDSDADNSNSDIQQQSRTNSVADHLSLLDLQQDQFHDNAAIDDMGSKAVVADAAVGSGVVGGLPPVRDGAYAVARRSSQLDPQQRLLTSLQGPLHLDTGGNGTPNSRSRATASSHSTGIPSPSSRRTRISFGTAVASTTLSPAQASSLRTRKSGVLSSLSPAQAADHVQFGVNSSSGGSARSDGDITEGVPAAHQHAADGGSFLPILPGIDAEAGGTAPGHAQSGAGHDSTGTGEAASSSRMSRSSVGPGGAVPPLVTQLTVPKLPVLQAGSQNWSDQQSAATSSGTRADASARTGPSDSAGRGSAGDSYNTAGSSRNTADGAPDGPPAPLPTRVGAARGFGAGIGLGFGGAAAAVAREADNVNENDGGGGSAVFGNGSAVFDADGVAPLPGVFGFGGGGRFGGALAGGPGIGGGGAGRMGMAMGLRLPSDVKQGFGGQRQGLIAASTYAATRTLEPDYESSGFESTFHEEDQDLNDAMRQKIARAAMGSYADFDGRDQAQQSQQHDDNVTGIVDDEDTEAAPAPAPVRMPHPRDSSIGGPPVGPPPERDRRMSAAPGVVTSGGVAVSGPFQASNQRAPAAQQQAPVPQVTQLGPVVGRLPQPSAGVPRPPGQGLGLGLGLGSPSGGGNADNQTGSGLVGLGLGAGLGIGGLDVNMARPSEVSRTTAGSTHSEASHDNGNSSGTTGYSGVAGAHGGYLNSSGVGDDRQVGIALGPGSARRDVATSSLNNFSSNNNSSGAGLGVHLPVMSVGLMSRPLAGPGHMDAGLGEFKAQAGLGLSDALFQPTRYDLAAFGDGDDKDSRAAGSEMDDDGSIAGGFGTSRRSQSHTRLSRRKNSWGDDIPQPGIRAVGSASSLTSNGHIAAGGRAASVGSGGGFASPDKSTSSAPASLPVLSPQPTPAAAAPPSSQRPPESSGRHAAGDDSDDGRRRVADAKKRRKKAYQLTKTGALRMEGFVIREQGITEVPDAARLNGQRSSSASAAAGAAPGGAGAAPGRQATSASDALNPTATAVGDISAVNFKDTCVRIEVLGQGASGTVFKMVHVPSLTLLAAKMIPLLDEEKLHGVNKELKALFRNKAGSTPFMTQRQAASAAAGTLSSGVLGGQSVGGPETATLTSSPSTTNVLTVGAPASAVTANPASSVAGLAAPCPYVVTFYDAFVVPSDHTLVFVTEYMDGGSLQDIIDRPGGGGAIEAESVLANISWRVLKGLEFLHTRRMIHRDIKPSNLLINHFGDVKIADFGIIRDLGPDEELARTFVGTMTYMSPERILGEPYGTNSDVWSVGLSILACAVGQYPLGQSTGYWDLLHRLQADEPPLPPADKFSESFRDFIRLTLTRDPRTRPSAATLLKHPFVLNCSGAKQAVLAEAGRAPAKPKPRPVPAPDQLNPGVLEDLIQAIKKVQEYRYLAAVKKGKSRLPLIPVPRLEWLADQMGVPSIVVKKLVDKAQRKYEDKLTKLKERVLRELGQAITGGGQAAPGGGTGAPTSPDHQPGPNSLIVGHQLSVALEAPEEDAEGEADVNTPAAAVSQPASGAAPPGSLMLPAAAAASSAGALLSSPPPSASGHVQLHAAPLGVGAGGRHRSVHSAGPGMMMQLAPILEAP